MSFGRIRNPVGRFNRTVRERMDKSVLLLLPMVLFLVGFFVIPFLLLIRMSLYEEASVGAFVEGTLTLDNFLLVFTDGFIRSLTVTTTTMAVIATLIVLVLGTYYAYALWQSSGITKTILLTAMILPLLTTLVIKLYAWVILLAPQGTINNALVWTPLVTDPLPLLNNRFGAILGMVYVTLPYAALPIYAVMESMDKNVIDASRDLGAGRVRSVWEVVIPQALPGILVAAVVSWAWNFGAYTAPALLGGSPERTLAIEAEHQLFSRFNWSRAAALSIAMLIVVIISVSIIAKVISRIGGGLDDVI